VGLNSTVVLSPNLLCNSTPILPAKYFGDFTDRPYGKITSFFVLPYSQDQPIFVYGKIFLHLICRTFPLVGCLRQQALSCCLCFYCTRYRIVHTRSTRQLRYYCLRGPRHYCITYAGLLRSPT